MEKTADKKIEGQQVTKKLAVDPKDSVRALVLQMKSQFALALPKHITPDRFMRVALTAINKTPKLLECSKDSLLAALMDCSQFGLEPDGRKAHLIPYRGMVKLIFDYKGLVDLARRSGQISDIHADIVCESDFFEYSFGTEGKLIHKPALANRGSVVGAYSFVKLKDGSVSYEVMSVEEIEAVKERSEGWKAFKEKKISTNPWHTDWSEMAKKTVFRRHSKWLPLSSEFQEAIEKDFDVPSDIINVDKPLIEMPKPKVEKPEQETVVEPVAEERDPGAEG